VGLCFKLSCRSSISGARTLLGMGNPFDAPGISAGYAIHRPPIHSEIVRLAALTLGRSLPVERALDVGCGAGLSTNALDGIAAGSIGIEPAETMLRSAATLAPSSRFAVAAAEAIPLRDGSVDLITAAGSLNYVNLNRFFAEAKRVLRGNGALLVYDFSTARNFRENDRLDSWFSQFIERFPWPANEARQLNPEILSGLDSGFDVHGDRFEIGLELSPQFYVNYMMTETNVAYAMRRGATADDIRLWLRETLEPVWNGKGHEVLFRGYFAWMTPKDAANAERQWGPE
jgi:SAM-dependent methyltransferase